jgi:hypothetical protein
MGEGLSKVNKLNVTFDLLTFDNPSLFPFHAFRENKRIYNYFFNKYVFSQQKVYLCRLINYLNRNCFCIILKQIR